MNGSSNGRSNLGKRGLMVLQKTKEEPKIRRQSSFEKEQISRRRYMRAAGIFKKMNEKLDPNARVLVREYYKASARDGNRLDRKSFGDVLSGCKLVYKGMKSTDIDIMFEWVLFKEQEASGNLNQCDVSFSLFRQCLDMEWIDLGPPKSRRYDIKYVEALKRRILKHAREKFFGRREATADMLKKMYRILRGDASGNASEACFHLERFRSAIQAYGLSPQESYDISMACDVDGDGCISLTDFMRTMGHSADNSEQESFIIGARVRSLKCLEGRLKAMQNMRAHHADEETMSARHTISERERLFAQGAEKLLKKMATINGSTNVATLGIKAASSHGSDRGDLKRWDKSMHHRPIEWMPSKPQAVSPVSAARQYFTETGYNASTMRLASKIHQQERYESGLKAMREHEEKKQWKAQVGRVLTATNARYAFSKRAQERQEGVLRRAALSGKRAVPGTRLKCFEGCIPFLNPNLDRMLGRHALGIDERQ